MATTVDTQASKYSDAALLVGRILIAAYNKAKGYGVALGHPGAQVVLC